MQGLLLIDKPINWTSFDVVNYVRKIVAQAEGKKPKNCKVGHTGTLDPMATGLLLLLVGKDYTRRAAGLSKLDKTYEVTMKLGETSTTADQEGEITPYSGPNPTTTPMSGADTKAVQQTTPTKKAVLEALERLQGPIMQTPPLFSAMKINGQRAYKLARASQAVVLEPRPVTIYSNQLTSYAYPYVKFTSQVGSGTYIRSLVVDLGEILQIGAYMSDLRRTVIAHWDVDNAITVEGIDADKLAAALQELPA